MKEFEKQMNIRISEADRQNITRLAKKFRLSKSKAIRHAVILALAATNSTVNKTVMKSTT